MRVCTVLGAAAYRAMHPEEPQAANGARCLSAFDDSALRRVYGGAAVHEPGQDKRDGRAVGVPGGKRRRARVRDAVRALVRAALEAARGFNGTGCDCGLGARTIATNPTQSDNMPPVALRRPTWAAAGARGPGGQGGRWAPNAERAAVGAGGRRARVGAGRGRVGTGQHPALAAAPVCWWRGEWLAFTCSAALPLRGAVFENVACDRGSAGCVPICVTRATARRVRCAAALLSACASSLQRLSC